MAKSSGLGDNCYIGGYDLSGDIMALSKVSGGPATLDVTAINKSAHERIGGIRDGALDFSSAFNPSPNQEHPVLAALPTAANWISPPRWRSTGRSSRRTARRPSPSPT